ncbi:MAG: 50S ribosomal protein L9 [Candidatus Melainabacteria bacterium]|jgi:large subunit ribosomal protein L9|nr:50S ribosomal protein L9 [Candidatus Melainabacteria bacterium]MBX9674841.1 50S ribosomal protein L9 [Candidatus Obscuribacterales bacterium]
MKVILLHSVPKLGKAGDIVEAKPGYFRNYLQPRGYGVVATGGTLKKREEDLAALRKKAEKAHEAALALAERINALGTVKVAAKVGEAGKLYGKITNKEIALLVQQALNEQGVEIDKRGVKTDVEVNALGTYNVTVKVAADVQSELQLEVLHEGALAAV